ncbi:ABC transporter permease [Chitinibacteraceae bacterium HSL-7]
MSPLAAFWRALVRGQHRTLLAALVVTIAALSSVGWLGARVQSLLASEAANLLAADVVLRGDQPLPETAGDAAKAQGLSVAATQQFPSMVAGPQDTALASVKAITGPYPLRGALTVFNGRASGATQGPPPAGTVWLDGRLADRLGVKVGGDVRLGRLTMRVAGLIEREPDVAFNVAALQPRLMMNAEDLKESGLIGFGSRIQYRLLVAGDAVARDAWRAGLTLSTGERIEDVREGQPQLSETLDRAETFLRLTTLLAALLASVAVLLAARRYAGTKVDEVALLVTLGATRARIRRVLAFELLALFVLAMLLGGGIGLAAQGVLAGWLQPRLPAPLPAPAIWPWLAASGLTAVLLLGVAGPALDQLARTPPARVLRRELVAESRVWLGWTLALGSAAIVLALIAGNPLMAALVALGLVVLLLLSGLIGAGLLLVLRRFASGFAVRIALRQLIRRRWLSATQLGALAVGLLGLWLLTVVQSQLLEAWQQRIPPDAPNVFAFNIQPEQRETVSEQIERSGLPAPVLQPMIRGRWVEANGVAVEPQRYRDERAERLATREFNLSWGDTLRGDNRVVAGAYGSGWSVEAELASTLGIKLGDTLTFDVAGTRVSARVTSLREVAWDSLHVNFFVTGTPEMFGEVPTSLITSFHVPTGKMGDVNRWSKALPNVTFIDVGHTLAEVQRVLDLATAVLRLVFVFCVAAGVVVLLAALETSASERRQEAAILRALGATRRQIAAVQWWEGALIGGVAGLVAGATASALAMVLAKQLFDLTTPFNIWLLPVSMLSGISLASLVTWWERRRLVRQSALTLLRDPG